ncbi:MAG TPA: TonB-dependent receptor [Acidobacteriaceae bacterium]|nr:TonB-dependent receptor [Acidobacteriaceae bacterium]
MVGGWVTFICCLFVSICTLRADVVGSVSGTVVDSSGAVVPNATVELKNADTGYERQITVDSAGFFQFLSVPVGDHYQLSVQANGFKPLNQTDIKLLVNQNYRADFRLEVGSVSQTVNVQGAPVEVETASNQIGDVIEDQKMTALPLNGRSYIDLLGLQAGVVAVGSRQSQLNFPKPADGLGDVGNLSVNGMQESYNEFVVNGATAQEVVNNGAAIVPVLDSIQEFRLLTNTFDAEYGHSAGAIVNVITKSGTNNLHGSGFYFLRNQALDARNYFSPSLGTFSRNQYGGTIGGPIVKDKLFFFGDFEGQNETQGLTLGVVNVLSNAERSGDFSGVGGLTGVVQGDNEPGHMAQTLTSRLGYPVTAGEPYSASGCTSTTQCVFPGSVIPQSAWSSAALGTLKFIPAPNSGPSSYLAAPQNETLRDDKFGGRVDYTRNANDQYSVYYFFDDANVFLPYTNPAFENVPGFGGRTLSRSQLATISNTRIFGNNMVNEARGVFLRSAANRNLPTGGLGSVSSFGFVQGGLGLIPTYPPVEGLPDIELENTGVNIGAAPENGPLNGNTYQVLDNFSLTKGKHNVKFGGEFRIVQSNERQAYASNGQFQFLGGETGIDAADYLIGTPDYFYMASYQLSDARAKVYGLYGQDSIKLQNNLTLNLGLRWDVASPFSDKGNKLETFVPGQQSTLFTDAPTGWVFPGDKGIPATLAYTPYTNFSPRIGVAYSPTFSDGLLGKIAGGPGMTSIRAAWGIFYGNNPGVTSNNEAGDAPYGLFYGSPSAIYFEEPFKGRRSGPDPGQRFPFTIPKPGAYVNWAEVQPLSSSPGLEINFKRAYAIQYNLSIERQISKSTILKVAYIGTQAHHLLGQLTFNPGNPATCLAVLAALGPANGCGPGKEDVIYQLPNGQAVNGTRPYSVTSGRFVSEGILDFAKSDWYASIGNSNYNSLQVTAEKRVGAARFLAAYTWSKSFDTGSSAADEFYAYSPGIKRSYALSDFNQDQNFVISYGYELPFQKLTSSQNGLTTRLLGGWSINGITRFTTGFPITMYESDDNSLCGCFGEGGILYTNQDSGQDFPNYDGQPIAKYNPRNSANHQYFDTSHFTQEALGTTGNSSRRFFGGPGLNNWDVSLHKVTKINERVSTEFRAEFFNVFNHAQFENPLGNINASTFGQVTSARDPRIGQIAIKVNF